MKFVRADWSEPEELSRPVRALWIEMTLRVVCGTAQKVEAREGLVD